MMINIGIFSKIDGRFFVKKMPGGNCDMTALYYYMLNEKHMHNWLDDDCITNIIDNAKT